MRNRNKKQQNDLHYTYAPALVGMNADTRNHNDDWLPLLCGEEKLHVSNRNRKIAIAETSSQIT
jgi:hypothetical protein